MTEHFVLMYHRVCERDASTRAWFERRTAVTPATLDHQLAWLVQHFDVVPLDALAEPTTPDGRARVVVTFDDGYVDTLTAAAPLCAHHHVTATCFASAGPALNGTSLWFDTWYGIVAAGLDHPDWHRVMDAVGIPATRDLTANVNGPPKQWLSTLPSAARGVVLARIAGDLALPAPRPLHLDLDGLRRLRHLGWRIGGHGVDHVRLTDIDDDTLAREVDASCRLLAAVGEVGPLVFAYPDGAWNDTVVAATARAGFTLACTTERGPWRSGTPPLLVPRLFCCGDEPSPHRMLAAADAAARGAGDP